MTRGRREWILQVVEVHVECQIRYVVVRDGYCRGRAGGDERGLADRPIG
jgi:hypothetical protein